MYTRQEYEQASRQTNQRMLMAWVPAAVLLSVAVVVFVIGRMNRSDSAWMISAALTVVAGVYALFFYGTYAKPMAAYRKHIHYMLDGRLRETTGYLIEFSENLSERNGIDCHAMMINVGEKDDREDDRLYYYDANTPEPVWPLGTKVTVTSNDMMVSGIREA